MSCKVPYPSFAELYAWRPEVASQKDDLISMLDTFTPQDTPPQFYSKFRRDLKRVNNLLKYIDAFNTDTPVTTRRKVVPCRFIPVQVIYNKVEARISAKVMEGCYHKDMVLDSASEVSDLEGDVVPAIRSHDADGFRIPAITGNQKNHPASAASLLSRTEALESKSKSNDESSCLAEKGNDGPVAKPLADNGGFVNSRGMDLGGESEEATPLIRFEPLPSDSDESGSAGNPTKRSLSDPSSKGQSPSKKRDLGRSRPSIDLESDSDDDVAPLQTHIKRRSMHSDNRRLGAELSVEKMKARLQRSRYRIDQKLRDKELAEKLAEVERARTKLERARAEFAEKNLTRTYDHVQAQERIIYLQEERAQLQAALARSEAESRSLRREQYGPSDSDDDDHASNLSRSHDVHMTDAPPHYRHRSPDARHPSLSMSSFGSSRQLPQYPSDSPRRSVPNADDAQHQEPSRGALDAVQEEATTVQPKTESALARRFKGLFVRKKK